MSSLRTATFRGLLCLLALLPLTACSRVFLADHERVSSGSGGFGGNADTAGGGSEGGSTAEGGSAAEGGSTAEGGCAAGFVGDDCRTCLVVVNGPKGNDRSGTGLAWKSPLATVQAGLDLAASKIAAGDATSCEVWVSAGTYYPTVATDSDDVRTKTVLLKDGVALYGGFAGTEFLRSQRVLSTATTTTLSGDIGAAETVEDNCYNVVTGASNAVIDGFVITAGYTTGNGAGMYNSNCEALTVSNCVFSNNVAGYMGGGMYNELSSPTVSNCTFTNNYVGGRDAFGGGMANEDASPKISGCTFANNNARGCPG